MNLCVNDCIVLFQKNKTREKIILKNKKQNNGNPNIKQNTFLLSFLLSLINFKNREDLRVLLHTYH